MPCTKKSQCPIGVLAVIGDASTLYIVQQNNIQKVWECEIRRQSGTRRGGQSAPRIQRIRDMDVQVFESTIATSVSKWIDKMQGVLVVGNGPIFARTVLPKLVDKIPFDKFCKRAFISDAWLIRWYSTYCRQVEVRTSTKLMQRLKMWVACNPDKLVYGLQEVTSLAEHGNIKRLVVHEDAALEDAIVQLCEQKRGAVSYVSDPWILGFGGFIGIRFY
jgi:peptide subunit release factor 1 (eRF1)